MAKFDIHRPITPDLAHALTQAHPDHEGPWGTAGRHSGDCGHIHMSYVAAARCIQWAGTPDRAPYRTHHLRPNR